MSEKENAFLHKLTQEILFNSNRFNVRGNIGWRVTIHDRSDDKFYSIEYGELSKFRRHWEQIKWEKKTNFLAIFCAGKSN